jgi:hypothetical protein
VSRGSLAGIAATFAIAAVLAAGYAAAGPAGLIDAASITAVGVLIAARSILRGDKPPPVRVKNPRWNRPRSPAAGPADFPAYRTIASQVSWGQVSRRHYLYSVRPILIRLAAALDRPDVAADLADPVAADVGGPGVDLATLERIVTRLEGVEER